MESPVSWLVLAAVRRQTAAPRAATAAAAAVSTGQLVAPAATVNRAPVISSVTLGVPNAVTGAVTGTVMAADPDGNAVSYRATTSARGSVGISATGVFTYVPAAATRHAAAKLGAGTAVTTDTVVVTVVDSKGAFTTKSVTVPISPKNSLPTAKSLVLAPNSSTGTVSGFVMGTDADKDVLRYSAPALTAKGGAVVVEPSTGAFSYTPTKAARHAAARLGAVAADKTDSFTVTVTDGYGGSKAVALTVPVAPLNAAPTALTSIAKPDPVSGVAKGTVTAADADADALRYSVSTPANGTVVIGTGGAFTYTPTVAARTAARTSLTAKTDTFVITVADGYGGSKAVAVTATIAPSDSAPVAGTPTFTVNSSTGVVTGSVNATDPERDALTYTAATTTTAKGTVSVSATGAFTYTPTAAARHDAAKTGATTALTTNTFTATVTDKYGAKSAIPVVVPIRPLNAVPVAGAVTVGAPNSSTGVVAGSVAAGDANGDALTYAGSRATAKGSVVVAPTGAFTYTPTAAARHNAAATGAAIADRTDAFTVTVNDGHGGSLGIPVTVAISPTNTAPVAGAVTVGSPNASTGVVTGLVTGSDPNGDALSFAGPGATAKGSVVVAANGAFTYTPTATARHKASAVGATNADKTDAFTVTASDGHGGSVAIPVSVAVGPANANPTGTAVVGSPNVSTGVVTGSINGSDANADTLSYSGSATTSKGAVTVAANGSFTYTPTPTARHNAAATGATNAAKTDAFTVTVTDGHGGSASIPVTVAVGPRNIAPVAGVVTVGTPNVSTGVVTGSVSGTDSDGDALVFSGSATTPNGSVAVAANGNFVYTPTAAARRSAGAPGATPADTTDAFTVGISDGHGGTVAVPVTVTVASATNQSPVVGSVTVGSPNASSGVVTGSVTATDPEGDTISFTGSTPTSKGVATVSADGTFTYTPTALARHHAASVGATDADTTDTFTITLSDGHGGTVDVPVGVAVSPAVLNFNFVYGTGSQYWTDAGRAALLTAAGVLSSYIVVSSPVTI
ncbi:MAG: Ig-like domain-containing protein, partial [Mycobacterium sp.]